MLMTTADVAAFVAVNNSLLLLLRVICIVVHMCHRHGPWLLLLSVIVMLLLLYGSFSFGMVPMGRPVIKQLVIENCYNCCFMTGRMTNDEPSTKQTRNSHVSLLSLSWP